MTHRDNISANFTIDGIDPFYQSGETDTVNTLLTFDEIDNPADPIEELSLAASLEAENSNIILSDILDFEIVGQAGEPNPLPLPNSTETLDPEDAEAGAGAEVDFELADDAPTDDYTFTLSLLDETGTSLASQSVESAIVGPREFVVDTLVDENNGINTGGVSLREAIEAANDTGIESEITFDRSLSGSTIELENGQLDIASNLSIDGDLDSDGSPDIELTPNFDFEQRFDPVIEVANNDSDRNIDVNINGVVFDGRAFGGRVFGGGNNNSLIFNRENLTLINSQVTRGSSTLGIAGGINNSGELTVINTTISNNFAIEGGGGISNSGTARLINTTVSGNDARAGAGGGISNRNGAIELLNSTVSNNSATEGGGISNEAGTLTLANTIIANSLSGGDISNSEEGKIVADGINLIEDGSFGESSNSVINQDPALTPLQTNGGGILTHALQRDSPAINAGSNNNIPADAQDLDGDGNTSELIPFDQRGSGFDRIVNDVVDLGAFEFQGATSAPEVTLTASSFTVLEGDISGPGYGEEGTFEVELSTAASDPITVDYETSGGTATPGEDFESQSGTLTFEPGETSQEISIPIIGDREVEPNESVGLELSNPEGANFPGKQDTFRTFGTIRDDDTVPAPPDGGNNFGDPHLVTLDGASYDFQTVGEFILTESESNGFEVQVRQQPLEGSNNISINTAVATELGSQRVGIYANHEEPLVIGDNPTPLENGESLEIGDGDGKVFRNNGNRFTIVDAGEDGEVNAGDSQVVATVREDRVDIELYAADSQQGNLRGLLGNFNDDPSDDLARRDGTTLDQPVSFDTLVNQFADSWRITQENSLFSYQGDNTTETFTNRDFPNRPITVEDLSEEERAEAEQLVDEAGITAPNLRDAAILDVALSGDESFIQGAAQAQISQQEAEIEPPENVAPRVVQSIPDQDATQGELFEFQFPLATFRDRETSNEDLSYSLGNPDALPEGLSFNATERTFNGTPQEAGSFEIEVVAADEGDATASDSFTLNVADTALNLVEGTADSDRLAGTEEDDRILGKESRDLIRGAEGDDVIEPGPGRDVMVGQAGEDQFVLKPDWGPNQIRDFTLGKDQVKIINGIFDESEGIEALMEALSITNTRTGTRIAVEESGKVLADLFGIQAENLGEEDFAPIA